MSILQPKELVEALKYPKIQSLGGYTLHGSLSNGEEVCFECLHKPEFIWQAFRRARGQDRWMPGVVGLDINWEKPGVQCSECKQPIPPEYGD